MGALQRHLREDPRRREERRRALLEAAFPHGAPRLVLDLLPEGWDPASFMAGPIFGSEGGARFYVADTEDRAEWTAAVLRAAPGAEDLLRAARAGTRRMVDTDGAKIDVYLDDLQLAGEGHVMCAVHHHPSGARSRIRLLETPLAAPEDLGALAPAWGHGRLAQRVGDRRSLLWITEAKHQGCEAEADALAARMLRLPEAYIALKARWPEAYIDGIELHPDGSFDLTPGF